jgi:hypothetical protein
MAIDELYANIPLDLAEQQIRLVKIQPAPESSDIQCTFHCFPMSGCPAYVALSYAWGPQKFYKHIYIENTKIPPQRNLWWFLEHARHRVEDCFFWIDAMCINQASNTERNHQVRLMGQIYSTATSVAVWLGEAEKDGQSDFAVDYVRRKGILPLRSKAGRLQPIWDPAQAKAFLRLCERSYWTRIWIVQEVMHANELTVPCGDKSFSCQAIEQIFWKLGRIAESGSVAHHPNAAAVLASPAKAIVEAKVTGLASGFPCYLCFHIWEPK